MSTAYTPATGNGNGADQVATTPNNFVLGPSHGSSTPYNPTTNGAKPVVQANDAENEVSLLKHLSVDLGHLLNRTDISDCFLNVKGERFGGR